LSCPLFVWAVLAVGGFGGDFGKKLLPEEFVVMAAAIW
jgi:hypothetical protein